MPMAWRVAVAPPAITAATAPWPQNAQARGAVPSASRSAEHARVMGSACRASARLLLPRAYAMRDTVVLIAQARPAHAVALVMGSARRHRVSAHGRTTAAGVILAGAGRSVRGGAARSTALAMAYATVRVAPAHATPAGAVLTAVSAREATLSGATASPALRTVSTAARRGAWAARAASGPASMTAFPPAWMRASVWPPVVVIRMMPSSCLLGKQRRQRLTGVLGGGAAHWRVARRRQSCSRKRFESGEWCGEQTRHQRMSGCAHGCAVGRAKCHVDCVWLWVVGRDQIVLCECCCWLWARRIQLYGVGVAVWRLACLVRSWDEPCMEHGCCGRPSICMNKRVNI